jgi:hypothetical protein
MSQSIGGWDSDSHAQQNAYPMPLHVATTARNIRLLGGVRARIADFHEVSFTENVGPASWEAPRPLDDTFRCNDSGVAAGPSSLALSTATLAGFTLAAAVVGWALCLVGPSTILAVSMILGGLALALVSQLAEVSLTSAAARRTEEPSAPQASWDAHP